jgi:hypothetical protein
MRQDTSSTGFGTGRIDVTVPSELRKGFVMKQRHVCYLSVAALLFLLPACPPTDGELAERFEHAVAHSRVLGPKDISRDLTAIVGYNENLVWEGEPGASRVRMVTWTSYEGYVVGKTVKAQWVHKYQPSRDLWVTAVPEVRQFVSSQKLTAANAGLRLRQLLGMPHDTERKYFVEFWVQPEDLFRPSPDPEITDSVAELDFPPDTAFMTISEEHRSWIQWQRENNTWPWTGLGYTYDWHCPWFPVGLSEFVIRAGAEITVVSVTPTLEYLEL